MKKVLSICLALVMVFALSMTAFAAPGSFLESPSGVKGPEIIDFSNSDPNCTADVIVVPYADRDDLSEDHKTEMEDAYTQIHDADDLSNICTGLDSIAQDKGILTGDLAVSDLFALDMFGCDDHDAHGPFTIKLSADTLNGFVSLIQIIDGEWVIVPDAVVDGEYITFSTEVPSTFAIVVDSTKAVATSPQTGDPSGMIIAAACAFVLVTLVATGVVITKKKA
ncbi:MAG: hypothetical protein IJV88_05585 [Ruminococcus sp.]|nr:hypothetical protein [Ruminococcus sp.]